MGLESALSGRHHPVPGPDVRSLALDHAWQVEPPAGAINKVLVKTEVDPHHETKVARLSKSGPICYPGVVDYPRIKLARLPTPIQALPRISADLKKEIYLWRDDLTGFIESGNKIRKLEFLLADAIRKKSDWIITCGGPQSNHTRATAAAARRLGMGITIVSIQPPTGGALSGNLFLNELFGADMVWIKADELKSVGGNFDPYLQRELDRLREQGKSPYLIPLGGSNELGCLGYVNAVQEAASTWSECMSDLPFPGDVFCALGSGGTFVGLALGLIKHSISARAWGVNILEPKENMETRVNGLAKSTADKLGFPASLPHARIVEGYLGEGYSIASDEDLRFYASLARQEGIVLDPCYTGKAFRAMVSEIQEAPERFGDRILFVHTGGGFSNFAYASQYQHALSKGR